MCSGLRNVSDFVSFSTHGFIFDFQFTTPPVVPSISNFIYLSEPSANIMNYIYELFKVLKRILKDLRRELVDYSFFNFPT